MISNAGVECKFYHALALCVRMSAISLLSHWLAGWSAVVLRVERLVVLHSETQFAYALDDHWLSGCSIVGPKEPVEKQNDIVRLSINGRPPLTAAPAASLDPIPHEQREHISLLTHDRQPRHHFSDHRSQIKQRCLRLMGDFWCKKVLTAFLRVNKVYQET